MKIKKFLFFFILCSASIPLGTLQNYLNLTEIDKTVQNLTVFYNDLSVNDDNTYFKQIHFSNNTNFPANLRKSSVLIIGGFYAGSPLSAFQVLYLADMLAYNAYSGNDSAQFFLYTHDFYFIPVLNEAGYAYMETNSGPEGFIEVKTGLEGNTLNCSGYYDIGINAYLNFPMNFEATNESCSNEYAGSFPLESNISAYLYSEYFKDQRPDIVISFQGDSKYYILPPGNSLNELSEKDKRLYEKIKPPQGYQTKNKFNLTGTEAQGSFLDYASNGSISIEVSLDSDVNEGNDIYLKCQENYDPVFKLVFQHYPRPYFFNFTWDIVECDSKNTTVCHYSKYLIFNILGINSGYMDFKFRLNFDPEFEYISQFTAVNVSSSVDSGFSEWKNLVFETYPTSQILVVHDSLPGFSNYSVKIVYGKNNDDEDLEKFNCLANFVSQEFFLNDVNLNLNYRTRRKHDDGDDGKAVIVGWVLMGIVLVVVGIAAIVLKFYNKSEDLRGLTEEHRKPPDAV